MHKEIVNILVKNHLYLAQRILPQENMSKKANFNVICSFCKKDGLKNRISACELNMKVIAC